MKKILFIISLLIIATTSCYKDEATFTVKISGYASQFKIDYRDNNGQWVEDLTVDKGFSYYNEYSDDWTLDLVVEATDSIFVTVLKRGNIIETIKGKDLLEIHKTIKH